MKNAKISARTPYGGLKSNENARVIDKILVMTLVSVL